MPNRDGTAARVNPKRGERLTIEAIGISFWERCKVGVRLWAVLNHNSQFTVTPKPSAFTLLDVGASGLLAYRWRQRKRAV